MLPGFGVSPPQGRTHPEGLEVAGLQQLPQIQDLPDGSFLLLKPGGVKGNMERGSPPLLPKTSPPQAPKSGSPSQQVDDNGSYKAKLPRVAPPGRGRVGRSGAGGGPQNPSRPPQCGVDTWAWSIMHLQSVKSVCGRLVRALSRIWAVTVVWKNAGLNWYLRGETGDGGGDRGDTGGGGTEKGELGDGGDKEK